jgi:hypothetical protein
MTRALMVDNSVSDEGMRVELLEKIVDLRTTPDAPSSLRGEHRIYGAHRLAVGICSERWAHGNAIVAHQILLPPSLNGGCDNATNRRCRGALGARRGSSRAPATAMTSGSECRSRAASRSKGGG